MAQQPFGTASNEVLVFRTAAEFLSAARPIDAGGGADTLYLKFDAALGDAAFAGLAHFESLQLAGTGAQSLTLGADAAAAFGASLTLYGQNAASLDVDAGTFGAGTKLVVYAGKGANHLAGGAANDAFTFSTASGFLSAGRTVDGGAGNDTLTLAFNVALADAGFAGLQRLETLQLTGTGTQSLALGATAAAAFGGNMVLYANRAASLALDIDGVGAATRLLVYGSKGNDTYAFHSAAEFASAGRTILADAGTDAVRLAYDATVKDADFARLRDFEVLRLDGAGTQSVTLGAKAATAFNGAVTVSALGAASFTLDAAAFGGSGVTALAGAGTNHLAGGSGADGFVFGTASGFLSAGRTVDGGAGADTLTLGFDAALTDADFTGLSRLETLRLTGAGAQSVALGAKAAAAFGGSLVLNAAAAGPLSLDATGFGAGSTLTVLGSAGADTLRGGGGQEVMTGGAGADLFVIGRGGADQITDFTHGADRIDLGGAGLTRFADILAHASQSGADTLIDLGGGTLTLRGIALGSLTAADFVTVPSLLGTQVTVGYQYNRAPDGAQAGPVAVGAGVEASLDGLIAVDVSDHQVTLTFADDIGFGGSAGNSYGPGLHFTAAPGIAAVHVAAGSTVAGLTDADIAFDADDVWINLGSLDLARTDRVVLDVAFA